MTTNQNIELNDLKPGMKVKIVNVTASAKKYTFKNGIYGEISFVLIVGAECEFVVGTEESVIIMADADQILDKNIPVVSI